MISVIVPVHNTEKYIEECIESILQQSYSEIEILCIDSSTDHSANILDHFSSRDSRIRHIRDENSSYGYKINRGIREAKGEYIGIVDSDDYIDSEMYGNLLDLAKRSNADFVKSDYDCFSVGADGNKVFFTSPMTGCTDAYGTVFDISDHLSVLADSAPSIWSGLYNTAFLRKHDIFINESPGASFQDTGFSVLTLLYGSRILLNHCSFYRYRTDNISSSSKSMTKYLAIAEEFHWIENQLRIRKLDKEENLAAMAEKKLLHYSWNYNRLRGDYAMKFATAIYAELKDQYIDGNMISKIAPEYRNTFDMLFSAAKLGNHLEKKMREPISVIVPIHNTKNYVRECLDSILDQTYPDLEILCIDSSTDETTEIVKDLSKADPRIRHIIDPNGSYGYKLNLGIREAKGEYIGIIDSDDYIERDMYSRLLLVAEENQADFVKADHSSFYTQDGQNVIFRYDDTLALTEWYGRVMSCEDAPEILYRNAISIWSGLYRTDFLRENRIEAHESPAASFQDAGFSVLTYLHAKRIVHIRESYYRYRTDNAGSSVKSAKKVDNIIDEFHWIDRQVAERGIASEKIQCALSVKKLDAYYWNYDRLDTETGMQFARMVRDELIDIFWNTGLIDEIPEDKKRRFYFLCYAGMERTDKIDISVIIPVYNTAEYLPECLDSVLSQNGVRTELICVNDGSTDDSRQIMEAFQQWDNRVNILDQKNAGLSCARNAGIEKASGKYILFLDSDDVLCPDALLELCILSEINRTDIILLDKRNLFVRRKYLSDTWPLGMPETHLSKKSFIEQCLLHAETVMQVEKHYVNRGNEYTALSRKNCGRIYSPVFLLQKDSKVILMGAGKIGREYFWAIERSTLRLVRWVDTRLHGTCVFGKQLYNLDAIDGEYDYLILGTSKPEIAESMISDLKKADKFDKRVIWFNYSNLKWSVGK